MLRNAPVVDEVDVVGLPQQALRRRRWQQTLQQRLERQCRQSLCRPRCKQWWQRQSLCRRCKRPYLRWLRSRRCRPHNSWLDAFGLCLQRLGFTPETIGYMADVEGLPSMQELACQPSVSLNRHIDDMIKTYGAAFVKVTPPRILWPTSAKRKLLVLRGWMDYLTNSIKE